MWTMRLTSGWSAAIGGSLALLACTGQAREDVIPQAGCEPAVDSTVAVTTGSQAPQILGRDGRPAQGSGAPAANETVRAGDLTLSNGHVIAFSGGTSAIGGFRIRNDGEENDRLISISSPLADSIAIFQIDPDQGEVEVTSVEILAGSAFTVDQMTIDPNRGRLSLRFRGLRLPDDPAEGVPVFLQFERTGCVAARVFPVVRRG